MKATPNDSLSADQARTLATLVTLFEGALGPSRVVDYGSSFDVYGIWFLHYVITQNSGVTLDIAELMEAQLSLTPRIGPLEDRVNEATPRCRDRLNRATLGSHESVHLVIGGIEPLGNRRRFLRKLPRALNPTLPLDFGPGESAQVDFGAGPSLIEGGRRIKSCVFFMVLSVSRLLYAELVRDQSVPTSLGCHRRAFEFFGGVTAQVRIDNAK